MSFFEVFDAWPCFNCFKFFLPNDKSAINFQNPLPQTTEPETSSHYDTVTETENQTATEQENNDSSSSDTETESSASEPDSVIKNPNTKQDDQQ